MNHILSLILIGYPVVSDIKYKEIPLWPAQGAVCLGVIYHLASGQILHITWWAGAALGCVAAIWSKVTGGGIGMGDCVIIGSLGFLEGAWFCVKALSASFLVLLIYIGIGMYRKKIHRRSTVAYLPFLAAGYAAAWLI